MWNTSSQYRVRKLAKRKKSPLEWWLTDGSDYPDLKMIARKLFSMATSSAASERNFSTMGFIHSKLRNSLAPQTVEKLVFIKSNLAAFYDQIVPDTEDSDEDNNMMIEFRGNDIDNDDAVEREE